MRLKDKVAIVTGGAKGIGQTIAELYAKEGAKVIAADMSELSYSNPNVEYFNLNVTDSVRCKELFDYVVEKYGRIDILVNNAGITKDALTRKMSDEDWKLVLDVNLNGIFYLTKHVGPYMQAQGTGSIINMSSVVGEQGNIGQVNYSATKAALKGMTMTWAKEFAMKGSKVRVNSIAPGYIMTDILKTVPQELLDKFAGQTLLGELGKPEDIADAALFLGSDESRYITAQTLSVNGGMKL